jgi:hypothetical protein
MNLQVQVDFYEFEENSLSAEWLQCSGLCCRKPWQRSCAIRSASLPRNRELKSPIEVKEEWRQFSKVDLYAVLDGVWEMRDL